MKITENDTELQNRQLFVLNQIKKKFDIRGKDLIPIIKIIPFPVIVVDMESHFILDINKEAAKLSGYKKKELISYSINQILNLGKMKASGAELSEEVMVSELLHKDGHLKKVKLQLSEVKMIDQVLTVIFITEDLLSSKAENQLTRTISKLNNCIEAQETAIQLIMHDLRGPLANIELVGNLLSEDGLQEEDLKTYLNILQHSSRKASRLIDSYHCFYRVENGSYQIVQNKFRLLETLNDIFQDYEKALQEKKLQYQLNWMEQPEPNGQDLTMNTDFLCYSIIINNLVKNAIEAAPAGSKITVTINCREKLLLTMHNYGAIPRCIRQQFFEKYITSEKVKGSGMGTYIVKKMMDILQGEITFRSSEEDGTFIQLSFPVVVIV